MMLIEQEYVESMEIVKKEKENKETEKKDETSPAMAKVEELRGTPLTIATLEELVDDNHAIVSS